jgi:hypothetical protein
MHACKISWNQTYTGACLTIRSKKMKIRSVYPTVIIVEVSVKLPKSVSNFVLSLGFRIIGRAPIAVLLRSIHSCLTRKLHPWQVVLDIGAKQKDALSVDRNGSLEEVRRLILSCFFKDTVKCPVRCVSRTFRCLHWGHCVFLTQTMFDVHRATSISRQVCILKTFVNARFAVLPHFCGAAWGTHRERE